MNRPWRIIRAAEHRVMPWKNGGGTTAEIAVWPEGATVADFDWRLSMATVASSGPFSQFPGVDRTLAVLDGEGIMLAVEGAPPVVLRPAMLPYAFPADCPAAATLIGGPIRDLNVMARRDGFRHAVRRAGRDHAISLAEGAEHLLLFCVDGDIDVDLDGCAERLARHDVLHGVSPGRSPVVTFGSGAHGLLVEILPRSARAL